MADASLQNIRPPKDFKAFWRRLEERVIALQQDAALRAMTDKTWDEVLRRQGIFRALAGILGEIETIERDEPADSDEAQDVQ